MALTRNASKMEAFIFIQFQNALNEQKKHRNKSKSSQILHVLTHQSREPAAIFLHLCSNVFMHRWVVGFVSMMEVWLFGCNSSMKTTSGQISRDRRWVYLDPTGLMEIFWLGKFLLFTWISFYKMPKINNNLYF